MKRAKRMLIGLVACFLGGLTSGACAQQPTITLNLRLETPTGQPIADAPLEAASTVQSRFAMTDANGEAAFSIVVDESEETIMVRMTNGGFTPLVPPEMRSQASARYHILREAHSFKQDYLIPITGAVVSATVRPQAAVTITGRLVDANSNPREGVVAARGRVAFDGVFDFEAGQFSVGGVPKGESAELWFGLDTQWHIHNLTPNETAENTDIGDLLLEDTPADGSATIQMQNTDTMAQPNKLRLDVRLSLIAADDAEPHEFDVKSDGRAFWTDENNLLEYTLPMPSGTYYVSPGGVGDRPFFALYESVKAGRQAQLDTAGVPKITIVAGQTADLTFDAQAALDAVIEVGGDLVDE